MGIAKRLSSTSTGRRGKWVVIAVWIIIFVVAVPLAGKLQGAEKNDASAYLPKTAEST
jgi:RND superfamily putative drug exporter